jgi:hypothetical protein
MKTIGVLKSLIRMAEAGDLNERELIEHVRKIVHISEGLLDIADMLEEIKKAEQSQTKSFNPFDN